MINISVPDEFIERFPSVRWDSIAEKAMKEEFVRLAENRYPGDRDHVEMEINRKVRKLVSGCGFEHDISGVRNHIELQIGRKIQIGSVKN